MLYLHNQTGKILVKTKNITVATPSETLSASVYYDYELDELMVIADRDEQELLTPQRRTCPVDVYAILHQRIDKRTAIELSEIIEAKFAQFIFSQQSQ